MSIQPLLQYLFYVHTTPIADLRHSISPGHSREKDYFAWEAILFLGEVGCVNVLDRGVNNSENKNYNIMV